MKQTKLTFKPASVPSVKYNIRMFQMIANGVECRFGSSRCAEHNVKLCRDVVEKRVACLDSNGKTTLRMREATILPCPIGKDIVPQNEAVTKLCEDEKWEGPIRSHG